MVSFGRMSTYAEQVLSFLEHLVPPNRVPAGVGVMNPYQDPPAWNATVEFYQKYYADHSPRILIIGINPGRFGGGITGIPFTDPINLRDECGITNDFQKRTELSSRFIYRMINSLGGAGKFYQRFFITATSPLGFVKGGKNLNYYDLPELQNSWERFMVKCLRKQMSFQSVRDIVFVLGQGKNYKYLQYLNMKHHFFDSLEILPHPRWVMQYRLKRIDEFLDVYKQKLEGAAEKYLA